MQVNTSLAAAVGRLNKTREERDQFDEASNQIVLHLKTKVLKIFLITILLFVSCTLDKMLTLNFNDNLTYIPCKFVYALKQVDFVTPCAYRNALFRKPFIIQNQLILMNLVTPNLSVLFKEAEILEHV